MFKRDSLSPAKQAAISLCWWFAVLVLLGVTMAQSLRPAPTLFFAPLSEDGYYSFAIARHIGAGDGITIDGIRPTNGFQPLVTFLQAGLFAITGGQDEAAIRLYLIVSWAVYGLTAALMGLLAGRFFPQDSVLGQRASRAALLLYLGGTYLFLHHFNGLETGLVLLFYALIAVLMQRGAHLTMPGALALGLIGGILVLARIDTGFFIAVLCAAILLRGRKNFAHRLARAFLVGTGALVVSAPWWWYNWSMFGSPMPISGTAQQLWAIDLERMRWLFWAWGTSGFPWLFLGQWESSFTTILRLPLFAACVWMVIVFLRRAPSHTRFFMTCLAITLGLLGLWYCFSSFAFWFYSRYLAASSLIGVSALAFGWARLHPRVAAHALLSLGLAVPVALTSFYSLRGISLYGTIMFWDQVVLTRDHVPPGDIVAAGQAGTLGFFRSQVVNLDGKVNPDMRRYRGRVGDYLAERHIVWFVDWPNYVEQILGPDPAAAGWREVARQGKFILYHRGG